MSRALSLCVVILAAAVAVRAAQTPAPTVSSQQTPTYWCPMHPDERATSAVPCPICKMTMVPIPPMRIGEYKMDVATIAGPAGLAGLRVTVRNPSDGSLVRNFEVVHEKSFHLFVVGRDLKVFRHLHPEPLSDGSLEVREEIPPGEYLVAADFLPSGGSPQLLQRVISYRGASREASPGPRNVELSTAGPTGNAYDVVTNVKIQPLSSELPAGQATALHVMLSRTEDGRPIVNLEPYLGAGGHLLVVSEDLTEVIHAHASVEDLPGSLLTFDLTLPKPGAYVVWVQFQRFGETLTARLAVTAR